MTGDEPRSRWDAPKQEQKQEQKTESKYQIALARYRQALQAALAIANDPYKAPELTVGTTRKVQEAAWNLQVEFAAMNLLHERSKQE